MFFKCLIKSGSKVLAIWFRMFFKCLIKSGSTMLTVCIPLPLPYNPHFPASLNMYCWVNMRLLFNINHCLIHLQPMLSLASPHFRVLQIKYWKNIALTAKMKEQKTNLLRNQHSYQPYAGKIWHICVHD